MTTNKLEAVAEVQSGLSANNKLRRDGLSAMAIPNYRELIRLARDLGDNELLAKAYADRGASKLALGFQSTQAVEVAFFQADTRTDNDDEPRGAIEDLIVATTLARENGRAWAQLGEAHRTFARDHFRVMPQSRFNEHIRQALFAFTTAESLLPQYDFWLLGHKAATHFHSVWQKWDIDNFKSTDPFRSTPRPDERNAQEAQQHMVEAQRGFEAAIEANPNYVWAKRFYAFLLTCQGKYDEAETQLDEAERIDGKPYPHVKRSLAMLCRYRAEQESDDERRRDALGRALRESQEVMNLDSDDFYAMYAHAAVSAELQTDEAAAICREARGGILNQVVRGILMAYALHRESDEKEKVFLDLLWATIRAATRDPEAGTLDKHDLVWKAGARGRSMSLLQEFTTHLDEWSKTAPK